MELKSKDKKMKKKKMKKNRCICKNKCSNKCKIKMWNNSLTSTFTLQNCFRTTLQMSSNLVYLKTTIVAQNLWLHVFYYIFPEVHLLCARKDMPVSGSQGGPLGQHLLADPHRCQRLVLQFNCQSSQMHLRFFATASSGPHDCSDLD